MFYQSQRFYSPRELNHETLFYNKVIKRDCSTITFYTQLHNKFEFIYKISRVLVPRLNSKQ